MVFISDLFSVQFMPTSRSQILKKNSTLRSCHSAASIRDSRQRRETAQREEFECQRLVDLALDADRVGGKR